MLALTLFPATVLLLYQGNWFSADQTETREQFQDFCLFRTTTHSASISDFVVWFQLSLSLINQNCAFLLRNLNCKLPNWEKSTVSDWVFFLPFLYYYSIKFKSLVFSSDFSPAVHLSCNLFIHLFEASLNSIWPRCPIIRLSLPRQSQAVPQEWGNAGQRQSLLREGWGGGAFFTTR